ncbi:hypothetical protein [Beijerinckia sp. L45]|uniref:AraC-like ligand-binding domain-containing protein n=1 Tax=Beijerinckia sp. L45 TaxID=1641855 RepID=UPI00131CD977|nr:hypothetical protein [Beijerinckia sp. L45]
MNPLIDLRNVNATERANVWDKTIRQNYLDLDIRFPSKLAPAGMIVQSRVGSMTLAAISSVAQVHERTASGITDDVDHLIAIMQMRGTMHLEQHDRDIRLTPGHLLVLDATKAYRAEFDDYQIFVMKIPRLYFEGAFQSAHDIINVCVGENEGSTLVVDYFRRMGRAFQGLSREQRVKMSAFGVKLLVSTLTAAR